MEALGGNRPENKIPQRFYSTFSGQFLKFSRALLAFCLLRGKLSDTSEFLRQMPYKHQSLVFSTVSRHWLSWVESFPLPYVKGTCFQEKCPLNIQLQLEVIFCMNGFLRLGLKQNKTCIKLTATLHIVFQGKWRIYCHVNDVHWFVSYWTLHVPLSLGWCCAANF